MSDSSDDGVPAWQRATQDCPETSSDAGATPAASTDDGTDARSSATEDKLTIARRFLDNENVRNESREKKVAFLKSKGVEDAHLQKLLGDVHETVRLHTEKAMLPPTHILFDCPDYRERVNGHFHAAEIHARCRRPRADRHIPRVPHQTATPATARNYAGSPQHAVWIRGTIDARIRHEQVRRRTHD